MGRGLAEVVTSDPSKENQLSRLTPRKGVRVATALALASGTAGLATLVSFTSTAQADPSFISGYVGVGADVTQDAYAAFSGASPAPPTSATVNYFQPIHSSAATNNRTIDSFDANPSGGTTVNPGCITTKAGGPSFDRPNSTTAGLAALLASVTGAGFVNSSGSCTGTAVIDHRTDRLRPSRPRPEDGRTTLTFIPFARDALGIVYYDHNTGQHRHADHGPVDIALLVFDGHHHPRQRRHAQGVPDHLGLDPTEQPGDHTRSDRHPASAPRPPLPGATT